MEEQKKVPTIEERLRLYRHSGDTDIRNQLVEDFRPMAAKTARKFARRGAEFEDLYQVALMALIKAIDRFDPDRDLKFTTYAVPTLVGEVKNYLRDHGNTIRLPRTSGEMALRLRAAESALSQQMGRMPTVDELAAELDIPKERVLEILEASNQVSTVSLDGSTEDEDGDTVTSGAWLGFEDEGYAGVERRELLREAMSQLNDEERKIIALRYFGEKTQNETGKALGLSQMYVSRTERKIIEKMRKFVTQG
ncbi:MAG: SigB/SigF/SigG family RNA polymerase sigma factor [Eubacteriales bacterium]|nr:SigB/SigF/SigG family RNA polymerase sigma factor [Eubacteriales bacterium]